MPRPATESRDDVRRRVAGSPTWPPWPAWPFALNPNETVSVPSVANELSDSVLIALLAGGIRMRRLPQQQASRAARALLHFLAQRRDPVGEVVRGAADLTTAEVRRLLQAVVAVAFDYVPGSDHAAFLARLEQHAARAAA